MIRCTITSPDHTDRHENIASVTLPTPTGQMQVLPGHAEAYIALVKGVVVLRTGDDRRNPIEIEGGECSVRNNDVVIIL